MRMVHFSVVIKNGKTKYFIGRMASRTNRMEGRKGSLNKAR